jgi:cell division topological specificity factor
MKLLSFFTRPASAPVARERLQLLLAHERGALGGRSDLLDMLRAELMQVIGKHVVIDSKEVKVRVDGRAALAMLEIDIEIRAPSEALVLEAARKVA